MSCVSENRGFLLFTLGGKHFKQQAFTDQVAVTINGSKFMGSTELKLLFL
jgi:hypothetical protein